MSTHKVAVVVGGSDTRAFLQKFLTAFAAWIATNIRR